MGIYNAIHDPDDDLYYYCPRNDCPCHDHYFYDSSGNYDFNDRSAQYIDNRNTNVNHFIGSSFHDNH
jgi:hypothetical protein